MKRFLSLLISLLLLAMPVLAEEEHEAHVFAPKDCGIALTMDDSWFHELAANLYAVGDRASSDPCEYSDMFFIYIDEANPDLPETGLMIFALSNRIEGSEHVPNTHEYTPLEMSASLKIENGREMMLWYSNAELLPEDISAKMMLAVNRLLENPDDVSLSEPVPVPDPAGFDALHGMNAVDLSEVTPDVLVGQKLTMINIWATYCNPCINEMPDLGRLNRDYADKGFQVIGILSDVGSTSAYDGETLEYAKVIIDSTGADYLHVVPDKSMFFGALSDITAVPTTYFLNENGQVIGEPIAGSRSYDAWAAIIDDLLAGME